jgi:hypothetical protein
MAWPMGSRRRSLLGWIAAGALSVSACSDDSTGGLFTAGEYTESGGMSEGTSTGSITTTASGTATNATAGDSTGGGDSTAGDSTEGGGTTTGTIDTTSTTGEPESTSSGEAESSSGEPQTSSSSEGGESSTGEPVSCGDGVAEGNEECDGVDLAGETCGTLGFDEGTLACDGTCNHDTSGCVTFSCGNGVIEGTEVCDGANLDGETCTSLGFDTGMLGCAANCGAFNTSGCVTFSCGNGTLEGTESCDGAALGGATCTSLGHDGGALGCTGSCTYDESGCIDYAGDCCTAHANPGCDDAACTASVCALNAFCCSTEWDALCASFAFSQCGNLCDNCGDGVVNGPNETCDGSDVGVETCATQGFDGGTLGCAADCSALNTSGCFDFGGPCCTADATPGCDDASCTDSVCAIDPSCCTGPWDAMCAATAATACPVECNSCAEQNIGSGNGTSIATGTTVGEDEDFTQTCGSGGAVDRVIFWTAPSAGLWTFDLVGSSYDTVLSAYTNCDVNQLIGCNDDFVGNPNCAGFPCSELQLNVAAGETVVLAVSGYQGATGTFNLNIGQTGNCCAAHATPGCANNACRQAVCASMPACCSGNWTAACANAAIANAACLGADDTCPVSGEGDCCAANGTPGCNNNLCEATICGADAFCCSTQWDGLCVEAALPHPNCQGVSGTCF